MNSVNTDSTIFVTKYSGTDNLFVKTEEYRGIVVTREGKFLGLAHNSNAIIFNESDYSGYSTSLREDVKKAIKDFLGKKGPSLTVSNYTGDKEYKGCFHVSCPGELSRVVNYKTREHMGFALSPTSEITDKYPSDHSYMLAIKKYLSNKDGSLCENGVTIVHYDADERYNHHVFVMIRALCFVVDSETRQVVGYVQNSAGKVLEKEVDKAFFEGLSCAVDFYSVVDSFLTGKRDPENRTETLRSRLEPYENAYLRYYFSKDASKLFSVIDSIDDEILAEIKKAYPASSDEISIMTAMEDLFCKA